MKRYAIEYVVGDRMVGVDESDQAWRPVAGHQDYTDESTAWEACDEFDAAYDFRYTHRVVEVEVVEEDPEPISAPAPVAQPAKRAKQLVEYQAQRAFERNRDQLKSGLKLGWPRVHLDPYVELMSFYVQFTGSSMLTEHYRKALATLRAEVEGRSNLRRVK